MTRTPTRSLRIVVLSRSGSLYSTHRIVETARARGHQVTVVDPLFCYIRIARGRPELFYHGHPVERVDAVIPRIGSSITFFGLAVVRQFEMMGVYALNGSQAIARSRDKLRSLQLLSRAGINLPPTAFARDPERIRDIVRLVGGAPVIVKLISGTQGVGVVLAESAASAESVIDAFYGLDQNILVQQYIRESAGTDIRTFVVGGKVVAAMRRTAAEGEFRSNIHRGARARPFRLPPAYRSMAVKAARVHDLSVAGVDLLESRDGPMVMEVNSSPGLEGIEGATGVDVAGAIIRNLEQHAKPSRRVTPKRGY